MQFLRKLFRMDPPGGDVRFGFVLGDIVAQDVDAVVNAADCTLLGGTGVDGALRAAAGPELSAACRALGGCRVGQAKATPGFRLRARHVVHTVAPVWAGCASEGAEAANREALACAYSASVALADKLGAASMAFPTLGAGAFGWPVGDAVEIAVSATARAARGCRHLREIRFVAFDEAAFRAYGAELGCDGEVQSEPRALRYHPGAAAEF